VSDARRPKRYRDVLALMKQLARNPEVSADALRAILAGNIGEGSESYTQADIARTYELAKQHGWELTLDVSDVSDESVSFQSPEAYQAELRRLHAQLRVAHDRITTMQRENGIGIERSKANHKRRQAQMAAAGVTSIDDAFGRLATAMAALTTYERFFDEMFSAGRPLAIDGRSIDHSLLNQAHELAGPLFRTAAPEAAVQS
jgi:hypothetical protein